MKILLSCHVSNGVKMALKKKKIKPEKTDGLGPKEIAQIRTALRKVWSWSHARRLVVARCTGADGYSYCEKCKERAPKVFIDHLVACGDVTDGGYIERLFTSSKNLQGLCGICHKEKTKLERSQMVVSVKCIEINCNRLKGRGRRLHCEAHYYRLRRTGNCGATEVKSYEKHNQSKSAEYRAWAQMWVRCTNVNNSRYIYYGARGITVCDEWRSFNNFYRDMGPKRNAALSIDRIDNEKGYSADNCRWATKSEQMLNRRKPLKKKKLQRRVPKGYSFI